MCRLHQQGEASGAVDEVWVQGGLLSSGRFTAVLFPMFLALALLVPAERRTGWIIAFALGQGLVAEGIESEAQRDFLLGLGVGIGQGFLFAPGLTPVEMQHRYLPSALIRGHAT